MLYHLRGDGSEEDEVWRNIPPYIQAYPLDIFHQRRLLRQCQWPSQATEKTPSGDGGGPPAGEDAEKLSLVTRFLHQPYSKVSKAFLAEKGRATPVGNGGLRRRGGGSTCIYAPLGNPREEGHGVGFMPQRWISREGRFGAIKGDP